MPRRANHAGSIIHRADGRWEVKVMLDGVRSSIYAKTQQEAETRLAALREDVKLNEVDWESEWAHRLLDSHGLPAQRDGKRLLLHERIELLLP